MKRRTPAAVRDDMPSTDWRDDVNDDTDLDRLAHRLHRACRWMRDDTEAPPLPAGTPEDRLDAIDAHLADRGDKIRRWVWRLVLGLPPD